MAYHCWQAAPVIGPGRALPHLLRAGEQAVAQLAYEAADEQFARALELAGQLPASPQATEQEIHIAARLGTVRLVTHGFADPDAARALARARSLAVRTGRRGEPADGRWALFMSHMLRCELGPAQALGAELVALGSERNDPAVLSSGHWQLGSVAVHRGDAQEAQRHLEQALEASRDIPLGGAGDAPVDLTLLCQGALGVARAYQGHTNTGLRLTGQAVGSARRLGDPLSLAYALICEAWAATVAETVTPALDSAAEAAALIGNATSRERHPNSNASAGRAGGGRYAGCLEYQRKSGNSAQGSRLRHLAYSFRWNGRGPCLHRDCQCQDVPQ
jgi:tetratricopeptide (TPR) repeat protein